MARKYDHIHKYEKRRLGSWKTKGHEVYKCTIPGCNHYVNDMELVVGRYSQCWGELPDGDPCPNKVEMTRYLVFSESRKHPVCEDCKRERKEKKQVKDNPSITTRLEKVLDKEREAQIDKLMEQLGKGN